MKRPAIIASAALAALVFGLAASGAEAQYYVPLRYDLRYTTNPGYIGPTTYTPPPNPDPYSLGSVQLQNLGLTGNLRVGRNFQATVPYNQTGSQFATTLPSMALSNFTRDSIGIGDVGTGVVYGLPTPYFPGSGSVTNVYTAETRFLTPTPGFRAPYTLPNLNTAMPPIPPPPQGVFYVPPSILSSTTVTRLPDGLYIPRSAEEWVNALIEGGPMGTTTAGKAIMLPAAEQKLGPIDTRINLIPIMPIMPDPRIGQPLEPLLKPAETQPGVTTPESTGVKTETPEKGPTEQPGTGAVKTTPPEKTAPGTTTQPPEPGKQPGILATPPTKYEPPGTYGSYMTQAEAAMKESNYAAANGIYEAAEARDRTKSAPTFGRIYALLGDRQYILAMYLLDKALAAHPAWAKEAPDIRAALVKKGTVDRIVAELKEELTRAPGDKDLCLMLGFIYYDLGQKDEAMFYLQHVARIRGTEPGPEQALISILQPPAGK
jgi:hypothetical protein